MTANPWPKGLVTALVTPLRDDGLDLAALAALVDDQIAKGVSGFVVSGGTGEYTALSLDERRLLIREAVRIVDGRVPVIGATGCLSTRDAIVLTRDAQAAGVAGVLVASPYGEAINWRERLAFYSDLDAAVSLPIMIYNTPPSGFLTFEQIRQLAALGNVTAVKDSSGDPELMGDLTIWARTIGFTVYVGKDSFLLEAILNGADGAVFGVANFIPGELVQLIGTLQADGMTPEARARWRAIRPFLRLMEQSPNYIALCKVGCKLRGIDVGDVRRPYLMPEEDELERLATSLQQLG